MQKKNSLPRLIYVNVLILLVLGVILEIAYRGYHGFAPIQKNEFTLYKNDDFLKAAAGFPELEEFKTELKAAAFDAPPLWEYRQYYYYAKAPRSGKYINTTGLFNARIAPDCVKDAGAKQAWVFGGSTLEDFNTIDSLTVVNSLCKNINARGGRLNAVNFGTGGFNTTLESIQFQDFLRSDAQKPDIAIFYDGFNEAFGTFYYGAGNVPNDSVNNYKALFSGSGNMLLFATNQYLKEHVLLYKVVSRHCS